MQNSWKYAITPHHNFSVRAQKQCRWPVAVVHGTLCFFSTKCVLTSKMDAGTHFTLKHSSKCQFCIFGNVRYFWGEFSYNYFTHSSFVFKFHICWEAIGVKIISFFIINLKTWGQVTWNTMHYLWSPVLLCKLPYAKCLESVHSLLQLDGIHEGLSRPTFPYLIFQLHILRFCQLFYA